MKSTLTPSQKEKLKKELMAMALEHPEEDRKMAEEGMADYWKIVRASI
ncbi:MAG: hypothetical protein WC897_02520 [Candidatus Gracilibacteria bacterium]